MQMDAVYHVENFTAGLQIAAFPIGIPVRWEHTTQLHARLLTMPLTTEINLRTMHLPMKKTFTKSPIW